MKVSSRGAVIAMSIGVCVVVGVPLGVAFFGLLTGEPDLILATDIAGVPVLVYALISTGPFAVIAGVAASTLLLGLRDVEYFRGKWYAWVGASVVSGLAVGVCVAAALVLVAGGGHFPWALPKAAGLAGAVCGAALGLLGWRTSIA